MNPFYLIPHTPKAYFCDRKKETEDLLGFVDNGSNVTLISPRRYGKTGLIYHVFDHLSARKKKPELFYVDIYATANVDDFIAVFAESIARVLKKESVIKSFLKFLGRIRPVISQDPLSGEAKYSFTLDTDADRRYSLKALLDYLEQRPTKVIVAIDEFQQIREYTGMSMEALLRTYIQPLTNVQFIFSGSRKHMMAEMFTYENSPFYESASLYTLDKIDRDVYARFIQEQFVNQSKCITQEAVDYILDWTRCHTFYTQTLCNRVFASTRKEAALVDVLMAADAILKEYQDTFLERRSLLTPRQWKFLIAVAKEGEVKEPTSAAFLQKYGLGAPSTASRLLDSLVEKELLLETKSLDGSSYCVYNVFFSRWLERL
ncbi:MAG: ATP-binding protein [Bacteroidales bacterium]|nr:ATP-binding protein [Bacteroidales bacterium]